MALIAATPVLAVLVLVAARPSSVDAHPLGNFTVNRYGRLELYSDVIRIRYVLDMAEIPAFQEMDEIDTDGDGTPSDEENAAYLSEKAEDLVDGIRLDVNGERNDPSLLSSEIAYPVGQAGLSTLRISVLLEAPVAGGEAAVQYEDTNYGDRIGWKEIVVRAADGVSLSSSTAPSEDVSNELMAYPQDLLSSPLDVSAATISFSPGAGITAPAVDAPEDARARVPSEAPVRAGGGFASLIDTNNLGPAVILLSLLLAFGFGAIHALEPGHGKTLVAAYFVGVRGTVRQAMSLGLIIAGTHTIGVLAIGMLTLFASSFILPERLYPWLSLASGLMILALGVRLVAARSLGWRLLSTIRSRLGDAQQHTHADGGHPHSHADGGHPHSHADVEEGASPWKGLLALGLADGLTPSPSALIVLLAAVSLDRIGLGVLLIVAFSCGLAAVLTLVCVGLIYARRFMDWLGARQTDTGGGRLKKLLSSEAGLFRILPVGGAFALTVVGVLLTVRALTHSPLF